MTLPEDIYSQRILELAAALPRTARLSEPEATATAHSKLCGSMVTIDLAMEGEVVSDYGQNVKACLLGQAASSVMGREIVGSSAEELREVGATMRKMLPRQSKTATDAVTVSARADVPFAKLQHARRHSRQTGFCGRARWTGNARRWHTKRSG